MSDAHDYAALGFKCGLEIHQRLATMEKLFCSCSAALPEDAHVMDIMRRQRAVAGETGMLDASTSFESRRGRLFTYELFRRSTCLVDIDEEPPHPLNHEALGIVLKIAASLNAKVPDELEVMRKEVVDGSDPSSFQRSILCGYSGSIAIGEKRIGIPSIFLEEESSGIEPKAGDGVCYNVSRLGIPLIEIDTDPVISSPKEAKEVAMQLGLLLRLTGNVQRGIGSIRQDVNVSIKGGARIEIKGFQDLENMDKIIEAEVSRQLALLDIRKELLARHASVGNAVDATGIFLKTGSRLIKQQLERHGIVLAARLTGFKGVIGRSIGDNRRLGSEISDYANGAGVRGILHSDEDLSAYQISMDEAGAVARLLGLNADDAFILISEERGRCERAMQLALQRADAALSGVPEETRAVAPGLFSTRFMRPLPGGSRMYPETDVLPIDARPMLESAFKEKISIEAITAKLYSEIGTPQLAEQMLWSRELQLYTELKLRSGADGRIIAVLLLERFTEMKRKGIDPSSIGRDALLRLLRLYSEKEITRPAMFGILESLPKSGRDVDAELDSRHLRRINGKELKRLVEMQKGHGAEKAFDEIMGVHRLTVDAEELWAMLKTDA